MNIVFLTSHRDALRADLGDRRFTPVHAPMNTSELILATLTDSGPATLPEILAVLHTVKQPLAGVHEKLYRLIREDRVAVVAGRYAAVGAPV